MTDRQIDTIGKDILIGSGFFVGVAILMSILTQNKDIANNVVLGIITGSVVGGIIGIIKSV